MKRLVIFGMLLSGTMTVWGSTIPVTGSGNGGCSPPGDYGYSISVSGSNGTDSASFYADVETFSCIGPGGGGFSANVSGIPNVGVAQIDGVATDDFRFDLSGSDDLILYAPGTSMIIGQADLTGMVTIYNYQDFGQGTTLFDIIVTSAPEVPESSTLMLMPVGLLGLMFLARRRGAFKRPV